MVELKTLQALYESEYQCLWLRFFSGSFARVYGARSTLGLRSTGIPVYDTLYDYSRNRDTVSNHSNHP